MECSVSKTSRGSVKLDYLTSWDISLRLDLTSEHDAVICGLISTQWRHDSCWDYPYIKFKKSYFSYILIGLFIYLFLCWLCIKNLWFGHNVGEIGTWPSGKLPFDCQKIAKNLTFFQNNLPKIFFFFSKKLPLVIFLKKMKIFGNFFWKKCQVFGNF